MKTTLLSLNDYELSMLDGIAREEIQPKIDAALERRGIEIPVGMPEKLWDMFRVVMRTATVEGRLKVMFGKTNHCTVCGERGSYRKYARNSSYHNKGDFNYKKPIDLSATDFGNAYTKMCSPCFKELHPYIIEAVKDMKVELSKRLTGVFPKYTRYDIHECLDCGWVGHQGLMGRLPAVMNGYYRGACPECDAKNLPFGFTRLKRKKDGGFEIHETQGTWEHPS